MMRALAASLLLFASVGIVCPGRAWAESPAAVCARLGTDDSLRPVPPSLVAAATKAFGYTAMPSSQVQRDTVYRCMNAQVFLCSYGANLPCGKAETTPTLPAATAWCAGNPNSDFIPAYVTGHDSLYQWSCHGGRAVAATPSALDPRGFFARYWVLAPQ